jgi:lysophospholipase L1-like esterase
LLIASLGLWLRYEAHRWGIFLAAWQLTALKITLLWHLAGGLILAVLVWALRGRKDLAAGWSRIALAALPFLMLISADRIATVGYKAIQPTEALLMTHPTRVWTTRPGWVESRAGVDYRINSDGLRGREITLERAGGERRVLFLGDSITYGVGHNEEDCFVWQVKRLAERNTGANRLSVINCSVIGYSPWQECDLLASVGLKYKPDLVLQVFCLNDPGQKFNLDLFGGETRDLAPPEPSALEWSGLFRMSRALMMQWFGPSWDELHARDKAFSPERVVRDPESADIREAWRITLQNMGKIVALAREHEVPLAIVYFPHAWQLPPEAPQAPPPHQPLVDFCREEGVELLDLTPVFRAFCLENNVAGLDLFPDYTHPTPQGNEVAARAIYDFLLTRMDLD